MFSLFLAFLNTLKVLNAFKYHVFAPINLPLFSTVVPSNICMFLSCRPFVVITTLSTGFVGVEVTSGQKHAYIRWDDGEK